MSVQGPALVLSFDLRSWLYALARAALSQQPQDLTEFMATYCQQLLEFRREHPGLSIRDLTDLFREVTEGPLTSRFPRPSGSPQDNQPLFYAHRKVPDLLTERELDITSLTRDEMGQNDQDSSQKQGLGSEKEVKQGAVDSEDLMMREIISRTSLQSAVFQRSSSSCHVELLKNTVICTTPPPSDQVIAIHSRTLPDAIVFHKKGADSSVHSSRTSLAFTPPSSDQDHSKESDAGAFADIVIYNKVPSIEDLPYPPSISEDLSSTPVAQFMQSEDESQVPAAQKEISELDLSDTATAEPTQGMFQKEMAEITKEASKTTEKSKSVAVSPTISFTAVHKQVSDTAVVTLLTQWRQGLLVDSAVPRDIRMTELTTKTSENETEPIAPQDIPVSADLTVDTMLSTSAFAPSNTQPADARINQVQLQDVTEEKHERQDLSKPPSDILLIETARSAVSNLTNQLLDQDFLKTCERSAIMENVGVIDSEPVEDLAHNHDDITEETLSEAKTEMEHRVPAPGVDHQEDSSETTGKPLETLDTEQTLRVSPEQCLTEQLLSTEFHLRCALEHPQHEVPEPCDEHDSETHDREPEKILSEAEKKAEHQVDHQEASWEEPLDSPEKDQTLRMSPQLFVTDDVGTVTVGSAVELVPLTDDLLVDTESHQSCDFEVLELSLQENDLVFERRGEPKQILSKAEVKLEHQVDHRETTCEEPLQNPEKEQILRMSPEFITGDDRTGSAIELFPLTDEQPVGHEIHQICESEVFELGLQEHVSGTPLPSVSKTFEVETSTLRAEEAFIPETVGDIVVGFDEGSDHERLQMAVEEPLSAEKTSPSQSGTLLSTVSKTFEEETSTLSSEETSISEKIGDTVACSDKGSDNEMRQMDTDEPLSAEKTSPSHSKAILLLVSQSCEEETSSSSSEVYSDDGSAHKLLQAVDVEQSSTETTSLSHTDSGFFKPRFKRLKSTAAQILKNTLAEKDTLMRRLSLPIQLKQQSPASESVLDVASMSSSAKDPEGLEEGRVQSYTPGSKPAESQRTNEEPVLPEMAQQQHMRDVPTPGVSGGPALEGIASQFWTLYRVAQTQTSPQLSKSGSEHDLVSDRPSEDHRSESQKEQEITSPQFTMAAVAEAIRIPNYVLITEEEKTAGQSEACEEDKTPQTSSQKRPCVPVFFSVTVPMEDLCAGRSSQTELLQVKNSEGNVVYSPGFVRLLYVPKNTPESRSDGQTAPPDTGRNMDWKVEFSVTQYSTSNTDKSSNPDFK